mmetsp:Transcript_22259/g.46251  ORF Transcript_22259/g.46251 Transcript_22259/m.46251 type:complete len:572 (+) Transcript_22259:153-1868(+)|eukprot:CAMPEP_0118643784 /NCGR_PEP_ID=MMETSP0785-20121206/6577_1 /TAXON_ID=91992 /ORGANISM="Bolidomonas pacifica, Strain CCMP 1866" /LENGTH=571 /DNA_ID=CAMNT_0006535473 /DNA_START=137 /DNA_END=1852 /DNA_ORIENTATION=-
MVFCGMKNVSVLDLTPFPSYVSAPVKHPRLHFLGTATALAVLFVYIVASVTCPNLKALNFGFNVESQGYVGVPASDRGGGPFTVLHTHTRNDYLLDNDDFTALVVSFELSVCGAMPGDRVTLVWLGKGSTCEVPKDVDITAIDKQEVKNFLGRTPKDDIPSAGISFPADDPYLDFTTPHDCSSGIICSLDTTAQRTALHVEMSSENIAKMFLDVVYPDGTKTGSGSNYDRKNEYLVDPSFSLLGRHSYNGRGIKVEDGVERLSVAKIAYYTTDNIPIDRIDDISKEIVEIRQSFADRESTDNGRFRHVLYFNNEIEISLVKKDNDLFTSLNNFFAFFGGFMVFLGVGLSLVSGLDENVLGWFIEEFDETGSSVANEDRKTVTRLRRFIEHFGSLAVLLMLLVLMTMFAKSISVSDFKYKESNDDYDTFYRDSLVYHQHIGCAIATVAATSSYCCNTSPTNNFFSYFLVFIATASMCIGVMTVYGFNNGVQTPEGDKAVSVMYLLTGFALYSFSVLNIFLSAKYEQLELRGQLIRNKCRELEEEDSNESIAGEEEDGEEEEVKDGLPNNAML